MTDVFETVSFHRFPHGCLLPQTDTKSTYSRYRRMMTRGVVSGVVLWQVGRALGGIQNWVVRFVCVSSGPVFVEVRAIALHLLHYHHQYYHQHLHHLQGKVVGNGAQLATEGRIHHCWVEWRSKTLTKSLSVVLVPVGSCVLQTVAVPEVERMTIEVALRSPRLGCVGSQHVV